MKTIRKTAILCLALGLAISIPNYSQAHQCLQISEQSEQQQEVFKKLRKKIARECRQTRTTKIQIRSCINHKLNRACSTSKPGRDPDLDGFKNRDDNCPNIENLNQADRDGDAVGDVCSNVPVVDLVGIDTTSCQCCSGYRAVVFTDAANPDIGSFGRSRSATLENLSSTKSVAVSKGGKVFMTDSCSDGLNVWNDITQIKDNDPYDFVLPNTGTTCMMGFNSAEDFVTVTDNNELIVLSSEYDCVLGFRDADSITDSSIPDFEIVPEVDNLQSIVVSEETNQIFLSVGDNRQNRIARTSSDDTPAILVFNDFAALVGVVTEPTISLKPSVLGPRNMVVSGLYLFGLDSQGTGHDGVDAYLLDSLAEGKSPDAVLFGDSEKRSQLNQPWSATTVGNRVFFQNRSGTGDEDDADNYSTPPVAIFNTDQLLSTMQTPAAILRKGLHRGSRNDLLGLGGLLFTSNSDDYDNINCYTSPTVVDSDSEPDLVLFGANDFDVDRLAGRVRP